MKPRAERLGLLILAVLVVGVQALTAATGTPFYLTQLTMTAYYTLATLGLCLLMGYAGQVSLCHGAFFAIGAYASAILSTLRLGSPPAAGWRGALAKLGVLVRAQDLFVPGQEYLVFTPWLGFAVALLLAAAAALLIGYPALRLRGHYLSMATLGFGLIVYRFLLGGDFTGGADGISAVPPWRVLPGIALCSDSAHRVGNYYFAWGTTGVVLILLLNLVASRTGRALRAIHEGENAANSMGVDTAAYKLRTFVISAVLAAAAGSFLTHYTGSIGPGETQALRSVRYVALVAAGGMANLWGTLTVSALLTFLSLRGVFGTLDHAVFGAILILIVCLTPDGPLVPLRRVLAHAWRRLRRRPGQAATDPE